ncbi:hypothetical protein [Cognatiyoonia sp. IB215182]|uniref:hypothetical protein n=1 Tax=Cognatiyoonia sp. IB215182 TaxID=3097353 RepID=UPI002A107828|nr:hypothetical protein [Cognatiyoonia sp. IB215182]MDX8354406.1 hypothetical protein [Cognatiyoonia sp. IB215182]
MTRLSISFAAALLTMTLTPTAHAYGTDPSADALQDILQIGLELPSQVKAEGTCQMKLTPAMAQMLALPADWRGDAQNDQVDVACSGAQ